MKSKINNLLFVIILFGFSQGAQAITALGCLQSITSDPDFNNNPHHPEHYFFAQVTSQKNQFLLIRQNKNFLCKTDASLTVDSSIDVFTVVPDLKEPRRLKLSQSPTTHEKPQTKSSTVPLENGFLPSHVTMLSALELSSPVKVKTQLTAQCEKTTDEKLIESDLLRITSNEIQDLYADFADQRDALAYNYDMKEVDKKKIRTQFDLKLKKVLELCATVPELTSVSAAVSRKINLKSEIHINTPNNTTAEPLTIKDKLHSGVKQ